MFPSLLKPDTSVTVGLAQAAVIFGIYSQALPNQADIRQAHPYNNDVEASRKHAAKLSTVVLGVTFAIARDLNAFIIGGVALVGIDLMYKHADAVHPATGKIDVSGDGVTIAPGLAAAYPLPDYTLNTDEVA